MDLRKSRVKKENPTLKDSRLFGIINKVKSTTSMGNSETSVQHYLNYEAETSVRNAMLEAELRKAQSIESIRQRLMYS